MKAITCNMSRFATEQPHLWGVQSTPPSVLETGIWYEWCSILAGIEDGDADYTADDLQPLVDCWRSLKRLKVQFDERIDAALANLYRDLLSAN